MEDHGASSSSSFKYDVFLSFRGDIRHTFADHLYRALTKKGIITFRDDQKLRLGDEIAPTLLEAIEKSRMSIPVLCENYASSTWCLDELVKIMECKDQETSIFPIFYHVEPSDVRHQKNKYEAAMIKHENRYGRDSPKVAAWRSALKAVSKMSGTPCTQNTYLKVEGTWKEMTVPDCIWSLWNLETLDLRWPYEYNVNSKFWKLQRLRHFYMGHGTKLPEDKQEASSKTMWNLQTLSKVDFDPPMAFLFRSDSFPNLRKLDLYYDPEELEKRCSLNELLWSLQHLSNLSALKIHCCGSQLSLDATMFPSNLTKITFRAFAYLDLESMKALGRLPNLKILKLVARIIPETLSCAVGEFPHLQLFAMESVEVDRWMLLRGRCNASSLKIGFAFLLWILE